MPFVLSDRRTLLRHAHLMIAAFLAAGSPAIASEMTAPIEQLHTGLIEIMKAGKAAPFRQRYDKIAPVIGRTFDLEVIVRQVIGPRWAALPPDQQAALAETPFDATPSRHTSPISTPTLASASKSCPVLRPSAMIGS